MNRMRLLLLLVAVAAGLLAAYLSMSLFRRPPAPPAAPVVQKPATAEVLVAGRNLPPGERLGALGLQWRAWPLEGVSPDMITKEEMPDALDRLQAARAKSSLIAGEPVIEGKIVRPGESGFLSSILPAGMRAISIPINELTSVSGFILPNDRVDVILTRQITDDRNNKVATSEAVLTNVKVLAIDQTLGATVEGAALPGGRTAVLQLEQRQAEVLARLLSLGQVSLSLRSIRDEGDGKPELAEDYRNPRRATTGPLIIRYGLERSLPRP